MPIPKDPVAFRDDLLAYELGTAPEGVDAEAWQTASSALLTAQTKVSIVSQVIDVLDALKAHIDDIDQDGLELLAGATYLIAAHAWHGRGAEALDVRDTAVARLAALAVG